MTRLEGQHVMPEPELQSKHRHQRPAGPEPARPAPSEHKTSANTIFKWSQTHRNAKMHSLVGSLAGCAPLLKPQAAAAVAVAVAVRQPASPQHANRRRHRQQCPQLERRRRRDNSCAHLRRSSGGGAGASLALSLTIGLLLAAIHSDALSGHPTSASLSQSSSSSTNQQSAGPSISTSNTSNQPTLSASAAAPTAGATSGALSSKPPTSGGLFALDQSVGLNLIPVDQPMGRQQSAPLGGTQLQAATLKAYEGSAANEPSASFRSVGADSYGPPLRGALSSAPPPPLPVESSSSGLASSLEDNSANTSAPQVGSGAEDDFASGEPQSQRYYADISAERDSAGQLEQQQQQLVEPPVRYEAVKQQMAPFQQQTLGYSSGASSAPPLPPAAIVHQRAAEQQQQHQQQQQSLERRFGLFKKGQQQQFGIPSAMSANYAAVSPFMSDCERCLANFGQSPAADLQQLEPLAPAPLPIQPPIQMPPPTGQAQGPFGMQPFAPLKSKFFMKFPFFVKPMGLGADGAHFGASSGHYWPAAPGQQYHHHHHHQPALRPSPAMSSALYIRPAPAYNCIQASPPPLLSAAASTTSQAAELAPLHEARPSGTKSALGGKQYVHQQVSY